MNAKALKPVHIPASMAVVVTLARLLQRLEGSSESVSPQQYRTVVERLSQELQRTPPGEAFDAVLSAFPAAAELYENLHYQNAGLCRSPLEGGLNAELKARELLHRLSKGG